MSLLAELLEGYAQRSTAATLATVATQASETARESHESRELQGCEHVIVGTRALTKAERRAIVDAYHELARTLAAHSDCPRAIRTVEAGDDTRPVLLAVALRGVGFCTMRVPRERYDGVRVLEMMERRGASA